MILPARSDIRLVAVAGVERCEICAVSDQGDAAQGFCFRSSRCSAGSLDERHPVPTVRAADFAHDQMIARIHGADLDLFVGKNHDDAVPDVDDHLLVAIGALDGQVLERPEIGLPPPGGWVARVDMDRDEPALRFQAEDKLAPARSPLLAQTGRCQPGAVEIAAFRRPAVVDPAAAIAGRAVRAPGSGRLGEGVDTNELAA